SDFLDGIRMKDAIEIILKKIELQGIGRRKVNYKMRDAGFSRQRYWGEPFPIVYRNGVAYALNENELPVELPHVENYKPGPEGEGPLANIKDWVNLGDGVKRETNTMPGYAGSSWYFLRYADPHNDKEFAGRQATDYWNQVDVYVGGTEHAVGHLLYSRMWTKVLYDLGLISFDEPFKKLVNQGMIQGSSRFLYKIILNIDTKNDVTYEPEQILAGVIPFIFISKIKAEKLSDDDSEMIFDLNNNGLREGFGKENLIVKGFHIQKNAQRIPVEFVDGHVLDIPNLITHRSHFSSAYFIKEDDGKFFCGVEVEKMSKSKYNTVNPNELIDKYGADTFRMYEMFLGPVEQSKPWDTKGIEGVHRFLKKLWRLFFDDVKGPIWTSLAPSPLERAGGEASNAELKILHKAIKKIEEDTERFSYNTAVSAFMVCVNELTELKCHKKEILEPLLILLTPYAPHIAEELYHELGNTSPILDAHYPILETKFLIESEKEYPVSINGKMRTTIKISLDATKEEVEKIALDNEIIQKWMEGKEPKKIIFVKNKMVNVVV
ncbi:MAG: class I tRNA ligase family protein, partial [Bacteroidota bacterium]|nr:class I tRNA ligase family protein [Bacteroidota bacterium]